MKILLVDDHLLFLEGLRLVLERLPLPSAADLLEAHDPAEAHTLLVRHAGAIELALVDLNFPGEDGLELLKLLVSGNYLIPVVVLSAEENILRIRQAMDYGAMGFIPKSLNSEEMGKAIMQVMEGGIFMPVDIEQKLREAPEHDPDSPEAREANRKSLGISKRQFETLQHMARGLSNKEIADSLFLSEHTVKSHVSVLFQLLDASNRTNCIVKARKAGLIGENPEP